MLWLCYFTFGVSFEKYAIFSGGFLTTVFELLKPLTHPARTVPKYLQLLGHQISQSPARRFMRSISTAGVVMYVREDSWAGCLAKYRLELEKAVGRMPGYVSARTREGGGQDAWLSIG